MSATYSFTATSAVTTPPIASTKVIVMTSQDCYYAINGTATTTSPLVKANFKNSINMQGTNNTISILPTAGTAYVTVTQVGTVFTPTGASVT